ncbi:hypothetical protein BO94DRAFT_262344 [Aspergillus sclerotioniger CBS 115572]|uniref:Uncharacterized protein n=1 Tax=Aspergillus sclerotioniger CBS 115572 TaxID=1450535 RepID=A0A317VDH3_9EURO|nr:hypothetical protein BO94DRAFT_262344 [Aspergillus sclerotioniger CBS 115572]PWY71058.1 hypothetical protein BO94DRAFT_262344 [Aspergillus sclerotioniger CBS 115572]
MRMLKRTLSHGVAYGQGVVGGCSNAPPSRREPTLKSIAAIRENLYMSTSGSGKWEREVGTHSIHMNPKKRMGRWGGGEESGNVRSVSSDITSRYILPG